MKNISLPTLLFKSLYSFQSLARYRFISIGLTIKYVFLLVLIYFLPTILQLVNINNQIEYFPNIDVGSRAVLIPIYLLFGFILNTGILFIKLSVLAGVGVLISNVLKRTLPYRNAWRLATFCSTLPTILFSCAQLVQLNIPYALLIDILITCIYLWISIRMMPKKRFLK